MKKTIEVDNGSDWMRPVEGAAYGRVSRRTFAEWMSRRLIPVAKISHRVALVRKADIDAFLRKRTIKAVA